MDKTNTVVKLCRRIEDIGYILSLQEGRTQTELDSLRDELDLLCKELDLIKIAHMSEQEY